MNGSRLCLVRGIEDRFCVYVVGAKSEGLQGSTDRLCLPDRGDWRQRRVESLNAPSVETTAVPACAFTRQRRPGPLRVVRPVYDPAEPHQEGWRLGITSRRHPVEVRMHMITLALPYQ